jgi:hypothetical protein
MLSIHSSLLSQNTVNKSSLNVFHIFLDLLHDFEYVHSRPMLHDGEPRKLKALVAYPKGFLIMYVTPSII